MDLSSAAACIRAGADGVAVVRGLLQSDGPEDSEAKAKALAEMRWKPMAYSFKRVLQFYSVYRVLKYLTLMILFVERTHSDF